MVAGLQEIVHLFEITRSRQSWMMGSGKTLREMERLPAHLVDDVNARGLPLDHHFAAMEARPHATVVPLTQAGRKPLLRAV